MTNEKIIIEDDFVDQENFNKIQKLMMENGRFPWYFNNKIDRENDVDKFQFIHIFYYNSALTGDSIQIMSPILEKINSVSMWRIKANLLTRTPNIVENEFHIDIGDLIDKPEKLAQWTTSIFYVNSNNGYTKFENGSIVESVANRMVTFPSNMKHTGTSCTDEQTRIVINFNYFK
jgi:hypothetical protein